MNTITNFTAKDLNIGDFIKTKLSDDILIVCDLTTFNPADHPFYGAKILQNPMLAFKPRHQVERLLLGPNRLMAMSPDGKYLFPKLKDIFYIIKNNTQVTPEVNE